MRIYENPRSIANFNRLISAIYNFCNVDQYFHCVLPTMESDHKSTRNSKCLPACSNVDFIAWQDMNLLPNNILPNLIDTEEEEDVDDVNDDFDTEYEACYKNHFQFG